MKKIVLTIAIAVFGFVSMNAQDDFAQKAESGSFYVGANIGLPLSTTSDISAFNFGFDGAYLFEVIDNLEVGGLAGYTHFIGNNSYSYSNNGNVFIADYQDASFIPIAASARYYFSDHKFFGGLDLGVGINVAGDAKTGFYARPKFGFDLGPVALIASFQSISGGSDYKSINNGNYTNNIYTTSGFNSFNVGVEFGF
ncbi:hypothetical protein [Bizionia arctica]|uniref:Outer membrane protein beta-barrel domain-containing protein n=1 Tax=Bizionia arctica TaxID=1495645 RepID=A0A917GLS2_9FLAO|nr:hypothetical protein [Bizionia arctica]GGG50230.1 hypothetical protein GCM10010976_21770 [Bizionia arctica]